MDGTGTGEHGVGLHKLDCLLEEYGADSIDLMARIERTFDLLNIVNAGEVPHV